MMPTSRHETGWRARLELLFALKRGRTELVRRRHEGPLYVQRVFHPEGDDALHAYLLHPPGGLVGGDELEIEIRVERDAHVLLTTPAAQKLYRSSGAEATARSQLFVEAGARLEWFPGETIAFEGSLARLDTRVELAAGAAFCGWDIGCLGRPTAGERYARGRLRTSFTLGRIEPLLCERLLFEGDSPVLREAWGLAGHSVYGNLYCVPSDPARLDGACELLRRELAAFDGQHAVTVFDGVLALRALGARCEQVRSLLIQAWTLLRPLAFDVRAQQPRIWST
jgi:urease accessory protein